jgi:hypothetical protein
MNEKPNVYMINTKHSLPYLTETPVGSIVRVYGVTTKLFTADGLTHKHTRSHCTHVGP